MALGIRITRKDGTTFLAGRIDEHVDFGELAKGPFPLKLDLAGIEGANSLGVRDLSKFVASIAKQGLELHRCSLPIVEVINSIPSLLGLPPNPRIVKSLFIQYSCPQCTHEDVRLYELKRHDMVPKLPPQSCSKCGTLSDPLMEAEDYFTFLIAGD